MITAWEGLAAALARLADVDDPSHVCGHHGDNLAKGSMGFPPPTYVSESQGCGCMSRICAFIRVSVNVQASDHLLGRRSDGPSEGWPVPLVLKTLNFPAVVTN